MTAGTVSKPANLAALQRLSPATSSYPLMDFFTMIGSITPYSLIEFANS